MKLILLVIVVLFAGIALGKDIQGSYEFPPPDGLEGDTAIVRLDQDDKGNHFAQVTVAEETIEGTNVVVGENQFSFDIEVETQDGAMSQTYKIQLADGEVSLSILYELGGRSESVTLTGKRLREIEGIYHFPPPMGAEGDTTTVQLTKNEEGNHAVQVIVGTDSIDASNVVVKDDEFSFDTEVETQIGIMSQSWKVQIADSEATLSVLADVGGQSQSMTLKGMRETEDTD